MRGSLFVFKSKRVLKSFIIFFYFMHWNKDNKKVAKQTTTTVEKLPTTLLPAAFYFIFIVVRVNTHLFWYRHTHKSMNNEWIGPPLTLWWWHRDMVKFFASILLWNVFQCDGSGNFLVNKESRVASDAFKRFLFVLQR